MDLFAYTQIGRTAEYVNRHYGKPPRLRGIRFMRVENPVRVDDGETDERWVAQAEVYNRYVGRDVVYVHTRCGKATGYPRVAEEESNYRVCGADEWEGRNPGTFLESIDDAFDSTYRDHYFEAVPGDDYEAIIRELEEARRPERDRDPDSSV